MKGIVLAGGTGSRLYPVTLALSKQLLPVYDKPMIYYPISVLMLAGIKEILIISTHDDLPKFKALLNDGSEYGVKFSYAAQPSPDGLAQALIIAEDFLAGDSATLILGDNIFYGQGFPTLLRNIVNSNDGATVLGYRVKDPKRFGVIEFDGEGKAISIEEKPSQPKSNYAVTGLYIYNNKATQYAKMLKPSQRGELEITDLNNIYLKQGKLRVEVLGRGNAWLDTGTHDTLLQAAQYVQTIENNQGIKIACLEEIAYRMGFISLEKLNEHSKKYRNNSYYSYISNCL